MAAQRTGESREPLRAVTAAVAASLAHHVPDGEPVAVALSGGRDSIVLLDALLRVTRDAGRPVSAIHVHHGLSPNADAWQRFCERVCAERGVSLAVREVAVPRTPQSSLEGEARRVRYAALVDASAAAGTRYVAVAHHRDDQAETVLMQLLRGAGPHGLSGMAAARADPRGVCWLRPLLGVPRAAIDAYASEANLAWIDDESNARHAHLRNAVRSVVMPALSGVFANPAATLARAAAHQADAARLADDLAELDASTIADDASLDRAALAALPAHRARNLLRWFLRRHGLAAPSAARLAAMVAQLANARADAGVRLPHEGVELGVHRGRVRLHAGAPPPFDVQWHGEPSLSLPHGTLAFAHAEGAGIDEARLASAPVHVRLRSGGERLQLAANRPRRALKSILHDAGIPAWERAALPLVFCGDALAAVAGVGVDAAFAATAGSPGVRLDWHPSAL
ncbi:MAG: tRNA lysidine(34) synthetase TilS [Burkholderiales bacterium]